MGNNSPNLDDCGCCEGISAKTPVVIDNRPGLSAVAYRIGTHSAFNQSLRAELSAKLKALTTRDDDDFTVALLDAWAMTGDVLTFYQERIANESFLRTASERLSLIEMARLIGYRPSPGVAASTPIAFTVDANPGSPKVAQIPVGTKVQSVPGPNELPQTFETVEGIEARAEWNAMKLKTTEPQVLTYGSTSAWFFGTGLNLTAGDILLFVGAERESDPTSDRWDWRRVAMIEPDAKNQRTKVTWVKPLGSVSPFGPQAKAPKAYVLRKRAGVFGYNAPEWRALLDSQKKAYLGLPDSATLTDEQKAEWPNFVITTPSTLIISTALSIPMTPRNLAQVVIDAVQAKADEIRRTTVAGAARSLVASTQVMSSATDSVKRLGDGVVNAAENAAQGVANSIRDIIDSTPSANPLDAVRQALDGNLWRTSADAASQTAKAVISLGNLADDVDRLLRSATSTGTNAAEAIGALAASLEVEAAVKAAADDPAVTLNSIRDAIRQAADRAPETARIAAIAAYPELALLPTASDLFASGGESIKITAQLAAEKAMRDGINRLSSFPTYAGEEGTIDLDITYPGVLPSSWALLSIPSYQELYRIKSVVEAARAQFMLSGKTTRLTLEGENLKAKFQNQVRPTSVFTQSEELPLLPERPLAPSVSTGFASTLTLAAKITDLPKGRRLVVEGQLADSGATASEEVSVDACAIEDGVTQVNLARGLTNSYVLSTVTVHANVATATHGESVSEVLGSGDGAQIYQSFTLKQAPVTHVSDPTAEAGAASTLQVRVNDVLWDEAPSLFQRASNERVYVTRQNDDGTTTVQFGDGKNGSRPQTGQLNVRAAYRKGLGLAGNVDAGQLSILMTRPLGVTGAVNPVVASGGDDPETLDDARVDAPLTVLTLGRVVSLRDYEDFARAFAGVEKAHVTWTWDGQRRGIFLTIAGPGGAEIAETSPTYQNLLAALRAKGDPFVPVVMKTRRDAEFVVTAKVKVDPSYLQDKVLAAVASALATAFSFENRSFSQRVALSEVMAVIQNVAGVVAVDVDVLRRKDNVGGSGLTSPLPAAQPLIAADGSALGAELLVVDPGGISLSLMK